MQNLTLKHGDMVKALRSCFGMVKGRVYLVETDLGQGLRIRQGLEVPLTLVWSDGSLGPIADAVARVSCPVVELSRGASNKALG